MLRSALLAKASPRDGHVVFLFALAIYVLFSVLDWVTTAISLDAGGQEGNPIAATVFGMFGNAGLLVFKAAVVIVIVAILVFIPRRIMSLRVATYVAVVFASVVGFVVIHNAQAYASLAQLHRGPTYHATAPSARLV